MGGFCSRSEEKESTTEAPVSASKYKCDNCEKDVPNESDLTPYIGKVILEIHSNDFFSNDFAV
jgi:hypothetical protein